ncbi:MAG: hypothetical protein IIY58_03445, partial [Aeriscardovia sp.]|nr:hypothetical protein [Aeriscardovia sp.]
MTKVVEETPKVVEETVEVAEETVEVSEETVEVSEETAGVVEEKTAGEEPMDKTKPKEESGVIPDSQGIGDEIEGRNKPAGEKLSPPEKASAHAIWLGGVAYSSKAEVARAFGISPQVIYAKLKKGWTLEQIVGLEEKVEPKINFRGKAYASERDLADAFGVSYLTYRNRVSRGWSQEEALGLAVRLPINPELDGKNFALSDIAPGLRSVLEGNIYALLGLPADTSMQTLLKAKDKLEKYCKLGAAKAYKGEITLSCVEMPERDIGRVQVIIASFDELENRLLWFQNPQYAANWNRKIIDGLKPGKATYDELLAGYYQLLISDSGYTENVKWGKVLWMMDTWICLGTEDLANLICGHLGGEAARFGKEEMASSFRRAILRPLKESIRLGDKSYLLTSIFFWRRVGFSFAGQMMEAIGEAVMEMLHNAMAPVKESCEALEKDRRKASTQDKTYAAAMKFLEGDYPQFLSLAEALQSQEMYRNRIIEEMRGPL